MKTLAWLFGIFVCASSAYGQKTVTIEGDIRNMPDTVRFLRGDERERDGCTTGRSGDNGERQVQIHQGNRQDNQDVHIPQQHRLHRMGETRSEHQNHRRSPLCAELAGEKRHSDPRTSRTEPLPGGYTGGKHTHPRLNGRVYETAPQDQSERFGRQTGICFDQADGEQHT